MKDSVGASFAQQAHRSPGAAGSSIIGMLEVIERKFTKNLAEPPLAEEEAENGYQKVTQENNVTKVSKEQDVKYTEQESANLKKCADESTSERDSSDAEFSTMVQYPTKKNDICVVKEETYEEKMRKRTADLRSAKSSTVPWTFWNLIVPFVTFVNYASNLSFFLRSHDAEQDCLSRFRNFFWVDFEQCYQMPRIL